MQQEGKAISMGLSLPRGGCGGKPVVAFMVGLWFLVACFLPVPSQAGTAERAVATWESLLEPTSSSGFETYAAFILAHPDWPKLNALRDEAERRAGATFPSTLRYFEAQPPRTFLGLSAYVDAKQAQGAGVGSLTPLIRSVWLKELPTVSDQRLFLTRFRSSLVAGDIYRRASLLVWDDRITQVRDLLPFLEAAQQAALEARMGLRTKAGNVNSLVARVPGSLLQDPGLLFDRARWRIRQDDEPGAAALLGQLSPLVEDGTASDWWKVRDTLARWALERGQSALAYAMASRHGFSRDTDPVSYTEAEWLAGWIALRFRGEARTALTHFTRMRQAAVSVISKARGDYWIGRATAATGEVEKARRWYQSAAAYGTTFYGQVAAVDGYGDVKISAPHPIPVSATQRQRFEGRSLVQAVRAVHATGDRDLTSRFFRALVETITTQDEATLTAALALDIGRRDLAVWTAKNAGRKGFTIGREGYPTLSSPPSSLPLPVAHAIIRQESGFDPQAKSPAGALGMMQLMPDTANRVARMIGTATSASKLLTDPQHNIRLGSTLFSDLMEKYGGSVVLAAVGYNAGPGRVTSWVDRFGDPRSPSPPLASRQRRTGGHEPAHWMGVDVIESYPFSETRFYIQQILANMEVYRAVLDRSGGARLSIVAALGG